MPPVIKHDHKEMLREGFCKLSDWAKYFDSGFSFDLNYDHKYEPQLHEAFIDYLNIYLKFVKESEPIQDE